MNFMPAFFLFYPVNRGVSSWWLGSTAFSVSWQAEITRRPPGYGIGVIWPDFLTSSFLYRSGLTDVRLPGVEPDSKRIHTANHWVFEVYHVRGWCSIRLRKFSPQRNKEHRVMSNDANEPLHDRHLRRSRGDSTGAFRRMSPADRITNARKFRRFIVRGSFIVRGWLWFLTRFKLDEFSGWVQRDFKDARGSRPRSE